ncbi:MAG TPA: DNA/RNA non-specific endonuclease [Bacteroidales bacterium]
MRKHLINLASAAIFLAFTISGHSQDNTNLALGNPSGATTDTAYPENYLMNKPQYSLSYNNKKHIPNWVSWHVSSTDLGSFSRQNNFRPDPSLPSGWYQVKPSDYAKTGFDKGHQCPSGDRTSSGENNSATFLMTNMVPQAPNNNRITWEHLESFCRKLVGQGNELYIICGVYGQGGSGSQGSANEINHQVVVPADLWKIVVVLPEGNNDVSRIDTNTRIIAVFIPNNQECSQKSWGEYRVSVDKLQELTGYDFLSNVPTDIQKVIEVKVDSGETN